ncbi:MAG: HIT family protein [Fimbriimonadaceae bacterium]
MQHLWAPWRLSYIEKPAKGDGASCIFVDLPAQADDRRNTILYRGAHAFVMLNAYPYTSGHLMVAPYQHTAELAELGDDALLEINQLLSRAVSWLRAAYQPDGFNIGVNLGSAAGAGIPSHIHWHVVPRWNGDTNYMTTVGDVRVLPQSLDDSYDRIRAIIDSEK